MCQRDFVCKHKSHDKYPIKKHVFVCHEHRNDTENQELLQKYKDLFIVYNEITKSTSVILQRSEAIIPHEPELVSQFSRNVRPREGNLHSADNIHSFLTLVVVIWFHDMQQSNQLEKEHLKNSLDL